MSIGVLLVDDHAIIRDGLHSLLEKQPDTEVLADIDEGGKAVELVRELSPDVVVMDVTMTGLNGIVATREHTGRCRNSEPVVCRSGTTAVSVTGP